MLDIPTVETERLRLRGFTEADFDAYAAIMGDAETMRYIGNGKPGNREDSWRSMAMILGHWELRGYGLWGVEEQATRQLVGRIGLFNPEGWPGLEVGWVLSRDHWGKGYATEAARASAEFAFQNVGVDRVISIIHVDNAASIRVAERIGETLQEHTTFRDKEVGIYGMSREEFLAHHA